MNNYSEAGTIFSDLDSWDWRGVGWLAFQVVRTAETQVSKWKSTAGVRKAEAKPRISRWEDGKVDRASDGGQLLSSSKLMASS